MSFFPERALPVVLSLLSGACSSCSRPVEARDDSPSASGEIATATLHRVHGDVRHRAARSASWAPARIGQSLHPADAVQTMADSRATVRFARDAALAELGPSTTLRIPEQAPEVARLTHVSGRLVARVDRPGDRRLEVELPPGTLVLGDSSASGGVVEARLDVGAERTEIAMVQGHARLDRRGAAPLDISDDHFVALDADGAVLDTGRLGGSAVSLAPSDGESVTTRATVRFEWEALDGVSRYRLGVRGTDGIELSRLVDETHAELALESGSYEWTVRGVVDGEPLPASPARALVVSIDRSAPVLTLTSPRAGDSVRGPVLVLGRTEPGARVWVADSPVAVRDDGTFEARHSVPPGLVNVVVRASDALGNSRVVSRSVLREP